MRLIALSLLLVGLAGAALVPALGSAGADISEPMGIPDAPKVLCRIWLRYHETDLCQGMDAVFVFSNNGMEVWSRIEDEESYEKLQRLLEPLHDTYRIEMYATHPTEDEESDLGWDPPSSLWENQELRSFLGDPFARARERLDFDSQRDMIYPPANEILRQRLLVYAEEVIEKNRKIKRYAADLPSLAGVATDPAIAPALRLKAAQISKTHAKNLEKELDRLEKNLKYAFPRSTEEDLASVQPESGNAGKSYAEMARMIAVDARNFTGRVDDFIHPKQYTVDVGELRRPGLLEAIKRLKKMVSDFQKAAAEADRH